MKRPLEVSASRLVSDGHLQVAFWLKLPKVKQYIDKLIDFKGATRGLRRVPGTAKKELELAIPKGRASPEQKRLIEEAVEYGRLNNITVNVTEM